MKRNRAYTWRRPTLTGPIAPLPSALESFTSGFGMGPGGSSLLRPPEAAIRLSIVYCKRWSLHVGDDQIAISECQLLSGFYFSWYEPKVFAELLLEVVRSLASMWSKDKDQFVTLKVRLIKNEIRSLFFLYSPKKLQFLRDSNCPFSQTLRCAQRERELELSRTDD